MTLSFFISCDKFLKFTITKYEKKEVLTMVETVYSFSRLDTFNQCEYQYYLNYVLKVPSPDNIYSVLGTTVHDIFEAMQEGKMTRKEALDKFDTELELYKILQFKFMSKQVETNYVNSINHAIYYFEPIHGDKCEVEKEVFINLDGFKLRGYIDLITFNSDGSVNIYDFKTSTKYSKDDLKKKARQLILYGIAMEQLGYKVNMIAWDMLKYCTVKGKRGNKTELRGNVDMVTDNQPCFITYPFDDETKQECIEWVKSTIRTIELKDALFGEWKTNCESSFFCSNICGYERCDRFKELRKNYFTNKNS